MELNWTTIGILVVVWVIGYFLGLAETAIKNDLKKGKEDDVVFPSDESLEEGEVPPPPKNLLEPEKLAVFQRISGAFKIRLSGEMIEYKADITPEERKELLDIIIALRPWIEGTKVEQPTKPLPADVKISTERPSIAKSPEKIAAELEAELEDASFSNLTMVEQIDRILKKKLEGHPLEKRSISLRTTLKGGLLVLVGLDEYEWIDEIPDQAIQDIIREAIAEWDKKSG